MVDIKRESEKVWLDLDSYYPPKFKQPVTDFKAITFALNFNPNFWMSASVRS